MIEAETVSLCRLIFHARLTLRKSFETNELESTLKRGRTLKNVRIIVRGNLIALIGFSFIEGIKLFMRNFYKDLHTSMNDRYFLTV